MLKRLQVRSVREELMDLRELEQNAVSASEDESHLHWMPAGHAAQNASAWLARTAVPLRTQEIGDVGLSKPLRDGLAHKSQHDKDIVGINRGSGVRVQGAIARPFGVFGSALENKKIEEGDRHHRHERDLARNVGDDVYAYDFRRKIQQREIAAKLHEYVEKAERLLKQRALCIRMA